MAYNSSFPANDGFLADFPPGMREQIRAIVNDAVVNALKLQGLTPGNGSGQIPVSNGVVNTGLNAEKVGGNLPSAFATAGHTHAAATTSTNGFMSNANYIKLSGIAAGAEVNQNAFSNVKVGSTTIQADAKADTLEIVNGANITVTPDATNDRLTIAVSGTVPNATSAATAAACSGNAATATTATTCSGNAATATKLATARTIALSGDVSGSASFDGSANATITTVVADDSHNHIIGNVDGLQAALDAKLADTGHSFADNGYQKFSSGLIIQWGLTTNTRNVTFPLTFPNACLHATAVTASGIPQGAGNLSKTGFTVGVYNGDGCPAYWFAIGC